ncbi:uncharacterized protein LOC129584851 isoform X2 [Paramacrobiotus metropolitanus]|uniref:uncharacterized protein LOC129584851 isoform X2 n=1 Tax=Paramacrobiotus metropolitanus TaxID=2943436 RepID=UPI002445617B|nr:uncharacterized protein LOC129584851 isoform X2 [Paramacrobiotus metropolitanus]
MQIIIDKKQIFTRDAQRPARRFLMSNSEPTFYAETWVILVVSVDKGFLMDRTTMLTFIWILEVILMCSLLLRVSAESDGAATQFRIKVKLVQFSNPDGILYNRKRCDVVTPCDPHYLRLRRSVLENPSARRLDFQQDLHNFQKIRSLWDKNIIDLNETVLKDISVRSNDTQTATVRVKVPDYDHTSHFDPIDNFECKISFSASSVSDQWSDVVTCQGINQPDKISIKFHWRTALAPKTKR